MSAPVLPDAFARFDRALCTLYSLAMFSPGANVPGSAATGANVLLRAASALRRESISDEASLPLELDSLRLNSIEHCTRLERVHDSLDSIRAELARCWAEVCKRAAR